MKFPTLLTLGLTFLLTTSALEAGPAVTIDASEAEAVLSILEKRVAGTSVVDSDWERLFESRPYVRLKRREAAMKRAFTDDEFREFVMSAELASRAPELRRTLDDWASVDLEEPIARALAYLPDGAVIRASIYPVIKPKSNSFVFDLSTDPAVFMYLDPAVPPDNFANTLSHEMHHIGYDSRCPGAEVEKEIESLPGELPWITRRLGAFGEGFAMLAAAGGPDTHPHETSSVEDRERWDRDVARVEENLRSVEKFIIDTVNGDLVGEERQKTFFSFYGVQGAWYTVGWVMASTIERELGRQALLDAFCDSRQLLATYNRAATAHNEKNEEQLPLWSDEVLSVLRG